MSAAELSRRGMLGVGAAMFAIAARADASWPAATTVAAPAGRIGGYTERGVGVFRGIRYGQAARFQAPTAEPPGATIDASRPGAACPQPGNRYPEQDEDCLRLNSWSAALDSRARKPVLIYFHGGAYTTGSVTDLLNDGHALAAHGDVVVVTVNHRLNAFGYLYLARLDSRFPDSGNAGQLDLVLALRWVRDNIAAFGGDPSRVTLFGQSGGGAKIATLMAMPAARGLFHRAVTMSGQQVTASGPLNAGRRTAAFLDRVGTRDIDALIRMPAARLVAALDTVDPVLGGTIYMGPVLDMNNLDRHPFWPDAHPFGRSIPMMLGNTRDETRGFIARDGATMRGLGWDNLAARMAPELRIDVVPEWVVAAYRAHYPAWTPAEIFYAATTAARSWRGQVIEAEARARGGVPAWVYQLDFGSRTDPQRGAFHTHDIPLMFGTLDAPGSETGTAADARAVSAVMQARLCAFAATGDPAVRGLSPWPRYDLPRRATMIFDTISRVEDDPRRWQRELFARIPYIQPGS
ncbi:MAG TPA: carboxylesterase family protein [Sphingomonas sp.]